MVMITTHHLPRRCCLSWAICKYSFEWNLSCYLELLI